MEVWNEEKEDQLISMIQERPALYDITENQYTNQGFKAQLWREIEHELLISEKELRKRWDSLRTQYRRYTKHGPSGSCGAPKTSRQQWIMTLLRFLEPHRKRPSNLSVMESSAAVDSWSPSDVHFHEEHGFFKTEPKSSTPFSICEEESTAIKEEPLPHTFSQPSTPPPQLKRSRRSLDDSFHDESNSLHPIGKTLERLTSREVHEDMISSYCKSMEHRMRKLPPHLLPHFMHDVDNSIFKYQVLFSSGENPQNTSPSEIHPLQPTSTNGNL